MKKRLAARVLVKLLSGLPMVGLLLFLPAGTFRYPGAWRMICVLFVPMFLLGAVLLAVKPKLLEKRLSRKESEPEQKVVSTGMYGVVRHPMYAVVFWMFLSMPVVIGSFVGMIPMVFLPLVLVKRIRNEETVLKAELDGYEDYAEKVRYRLIPFIW